MSKGEPSRGSGQGAERGAGAELPALACACRVEGPRQSCVEGEGFLRKSPSKEPHFTDVSQGSGGRLGDTVGSSGAVMRCWGQQWAADGQ